MNMTRDRKKEMLISDERYDRYWWRCVLFARSYTCDQSQAESMAAESMSIMWQRMAAGLSQCLPRKQAAWGVMPDRPAGADNPLSLTGTSAAVYAVAKGVRLGYLGKKEGKMAVQAFAALTQQWKEGKKEADSAAWYVLAAVELHRMQLEE